MPKSDEILAEKPPEFYLLLSECISVAEHRGTISYEDAGEPIDVIPVNMNHWSAAISKEVTEQGYPMLSAVIVNKNDGTPGDGFYTLAHDLCDRNPDPEQMSDEEKLDFWRDQLQQVYEAFSI